MFENVRGLLPEPRLPSGDHRPPSMLGYEVEARLLNAKHYEFPRIESA